MCPNRKVARERLLPFHKSASNITHSSIAEQKRSVCVLYTVQRALVHTVLVRQPVQCSVLCMPRRCTTPYHLHTTNANCALVPQYRNVSAVVKLQVVGKRCPTSCSTCTMRGIVHVSLSHCAFSTSLVDFHTLYDQPFGPSTRASFITC